MFNFFKRKKEGVMEPSEVSRESTFEDVMLTVESTKDTGNGEEPVLPKEGEMVPSTEPVLPKEGEMVPSTEPVLPKEGEMVLYLEPAELVKQPSLRKLVHLSEVLDCIKIDTTKGQETRSITCSVSMQSKDGGDITDIGYHTFAVGSLYVIHLLAEMFDAVVYLYNLNNNLIWSSSNYESDYEKLSAFGEDIKKPKAGARKVTKKVKQKTNTKKSTAKKARKVTKKVKQKTNTKKSDAKKARKPTKAKKAQTVAAEPVKEKIVIRYRPLFKASAGVKPTTHKKSKKAKKK